MVTLHFEDTDRMLINKMNFEWATLFEGSKCYVDNDIMVTSIEHETVRLDEDDPETEFVIWKFDVVFDLPSDCLDNVFNGKEKLYFDF